jgi:hypothetical protein
MDENKSRRGISGSAVFHRFKEFASTMRGTGVLCENESLLFTPA